MMSDIVIVLQGAIACVLLCYSSADAAYKWSDVGSNDNNARSSTIDVIALSHCHLTSSYHLCASLLR